MLKSTILTCTFFYINGNYFFANKVFNILIIDINKQLQVNCLTILIVSLLNSYICLLLDLVSKHNNK